MGQLARAFSLPAMNQLSLHRLETHFIGPDIYRCSDVADRQIKLTRTVSTESSHCRINRHQKQSLRSAIVLQTFSLFLARSGIANRFVQVRLSLCRYAAQDRQSALT